MIIVKMMMSVKKTNDDSFAAFVPFIFFLRKQKQQRNVTKTQLSSWASGWSVGRGSGVITSKPAAKI